MRKYNENAMFVRLFRITLYVLPPIGQPRKGWIVNMRFNMHAPSNICEYLLLCVLDPNKTAVRFLYVFDLILLRQHILRVYKLDLDRIKFRSVDTRNSGYLQKLDPVNKRVLNGV